VIRVGGFGLHVLSDGRFRLDGGAMFGVVPKTLWERCCHADDKNRIPLELGVLLIQTPSGKNVLVDAGLSSKYERNGKFTKIYAVERPRTLRDELKALGLAPEDIHIVVNTHLHFDHAGGDTELGADGRPRPAFPKARYVIQKLEWEDAQHAHERNQASYLAENFEPLESARALELVSGEFEIERGLKVLRSGGHTRGHQCVLVEDGGAGALFLGDLIPTRAHVPLPWIMAYDLYPVDTLEEKRRLLDLAKQRDWLLLFQHDPQQRAAHLREVDGRLVAVPPKAEHAHH